MLSLNARLLIAASIVLTAFLGVTGAILDSAYRNSAENALKDRLKGTAKGVAIALVVVGLTQFYNMVVETYFNDFYMTGNINTGINSFMALILLLVLIQRNSRNTIRKIEIVKNQDESKYSEDVPQNIFKRSIVDIIKGRKPLPRNDLPQKPQTSLATLDILKGDNED